MRRVLTDRDMGLFERLLATANAALMAVESVPDDGSEERARLYQSLYRVFDYARKARHEARRWRR